MRFELIFPGKTKEDYLVRGIDDFAARLRRHVELELKAIKAPRPGKGDDESRLIREEGRLLLASVNYHPADRFFYAMRLQREPSRADWS